MSRTRWIHSPAVDLGLAFCWVPFAVVAHATAGDRQAIGTVLVATFALSFAHQPLTIPIVYSDPAERAAHRRLYRWAPLVFVGVAVGGLAVSVAAVAVVAGLWNAEHTLMQRYGITRIYARKGGEAGVSGVGEKAMLVSWLVFAAVAAAAGAGTEAAVRRLPLGEVNREGLDLLTDLRPGAGLVLPVVVLAGAALTIRWGLAEVRRWRAGAPNGPKLAYLAATAALIGLMVLDPVVGFIGYVGAHAVEYFVIVHRSLGSRWAVPGSGGPVGDLVRRRGGRRLFLAGYLLGVAALIGGLRWYGSERLYLAVVLVLGGMHVLYDGLIWKLRRPTVAAGLVGPEPALAPPTPALAAG
ncbi:MAG TPA: hypothetical protein VFG94_05285 [Acidimicrobiales bacterium]|nr:hypothetical protein [Acidimicrobiales bacterium]